MDNSLERREALESVYNLLVEQKQVQEKLFSLAQRKRDAVVKNNTDELGEIVRLEYNQLGLMNSIEKKRILLLHKVFGNEGPLMTIGQLSALAEGELSEKYLEIQKELVEAIEKLREINDSNKSLVEIQLEYTEMMLNFLGGSADPLNNFYGTDGKSSDAEITKGSSVFDTEI